MFRQVKSFVFWTLLYRFRRRLTLVAVLLALVLMSQWIYADVLEYLKITQQTEYLHYILPLKWSIVIGCIALSAYLVLSMFNKEQKPSKRPAPKEAAKQKLSERERSFLGRKLRSKADMLMDR